MAKISKDGKGKTLYIEVSIYPCGGADPTTVREDVRAEFALNFLCTFRTNVPSNTHTNLVP